MRSDDVPRAGLSDADLALAVEDSLFALFRSMQALPGAELEERAGVVVHHAFPANPMFNGAWRAALDVDAAPAAVDDVLAWFQARDVPYVFWWLGPTATPPGLGDVLAARGLVPFELDAPGQAADLATLDWDALERVPDGFRAEWVADADDLATFAATFVDAFGAPEWAARSWRDATDAVGIDEAPWGLLVGRLDGHPVATAMLFCGAGVATVFAIGTIPEVRGRGIGAAITLAALARARDAGYNHAVLFATELGAPVYRRIGFRDVDARISRWLWAA